MLMTLRRFLFPEAIKSVQASVLLLILRLSLGTLFLLHGLEKFMNFADLSLVFPDPLGLGSWLSLALVIFAELFCSLAFMLGLLFRLALLPMIFTMFVAFFIIHAGMPFATRELSFIYLILFIILFFSGPGIFSVDSFFYKK